MLPWSAPVIPEKDESSILSELFSKPVTYNQVSIPLETMDGVKPNQAPLLAYEIAHTSCYDEENIDDTDTRLIENELSYVGYHPNRDMESNIGVFRYQGNITPRIPTIWECVKHSFTIQTPNKRKNTPMYFGV